MLTKLTLCNFKRFREAEIELGKSVVLIGPNNSGKTTALQALALWDIGLKLWNTKREGKTSPEKRPGVTINRRDLVSIPIPAANLLWNDLHVRSSKKNIEEKGTQNIRINIILEGITNSNNWSCGLEFDYSNEESFVCRPLRLPEYEEGKVRNAKFSSIPIEACGVRVAYLPPMSGLADREFKKEQGEIGFLIGQGQTAQVLRNLCYQISSDSDSSLWRILADQIYSLFGVRLLPPEYIAERGEIIMEYEQDKIRLDLSCSGRGLQQTLLLLAHLYSNPNTILLLDEPDAHLEILRQRQIFQILSDVAEKQGSQVIAASHSEVVLSEAAGRGKVVAFVGKPHTMNNRQSQILKSLSDIGWDLYYQAEETGWLLCLEGATDLAILRTFAETLEHPAMQYLEKPFVHYVSTNLPQKARDLFFGLKEAKPDLRGIAIFDHLDVKLHETSELMELMWNKCEIENYFCRNEVLMAYARQDSPNDLFSLAQRDKQAEAMKASIKEVTLALNTLGKPAPWSDEIKATDDFLDPLFKKFFTRLNLSLTFRKTDYYQLAKFVTKDDIDPDIIKKLDAIVSVAQKAQPKTAESLR